MKNIYLKKYLSVSQILPSNNGYKRVGKHMDSVRTINKRPRNEKRNELPNLSKGAMLSFINAKLHGNLINIPCFDIVEKSFFQEFCGVTIPVNNLDQLHNEDVSFEIAFKDKTSVTVLDLASWVLNQYTVENGVVTSQVPLCKALHAILTSPKMITHLFDNYYPTLCSPIINKILKVRESLISKGYCPATLIYRSSSEAEDGVRDSNAGAYLTISETESDKIPGLEETMRFIAEIWASQFNNLTMQDMTDKQKSDFPAMEVIIQEKIAALYSGVAYTTCPSDPSCSVFELCPGAGGIVQSKEKPNDVIRLNFVTHRDAKTLFANTEQLKVCHQQDNRFNLELVRQAFALVTGLGDYFGTDIDCEIAFAESWDKQHLVPYLLQVRSQNVAPSEGIYTVENTEGWDKTSIKAVLSAGRFEKAIPMTTTDFIKTFLNKNTRPEQAVVLVSLCPHEDVLAGPIKHWPNVAGIITSMGTSIDHRSSLCRYGKKPYVLVEESVAMALLSEKAICCAVNMGDDPAKNNSALLYLNEDAPVLQVPPTISVRPLPTPQWRPMQACEGLEEMAQNVDDLPQNVDDLAQEKDDLAQLSKAINRLTLLNFYLLRETGSSSNALVNLCRIFLLHELNSSKGDEWAEAVQSSIVCLKTHFEALFQSFHDFMQKVIYKDDPDSNYQFQDISFPTEYILGKITILFNTLTRQLTVIKDRQAPPSIRKNALRDFRHICQELTINNADCYDIKNWNEEMLDTLQNIILFIHRRTLHFIMHHSAVTAFGDGDTICLSPSLKLRFPTAFKMLEQHINRSGIFIITSNLMVVDLHIGDGTEHAQSIVVKVDGGQGGYYDVMFRHLDCSYYRTQVLTHYCKMLMPDGLISEDGSMTTIHTKWYTESKLVEVLEHILFLSQFLGTNVDLTMNHYFHDGIMLISRDTMDRLLDGIDKDNRYLEIINAVSSRFKAHHSHRRLSINALSQLLHTNILNHFLHKSLSIDNVLQGINILGDLIDNMLGAECAFPLVGVKTKNTIWRSLVNAYASKEDNDKDESECFIEIAKDIDRQMHIILQFVDSVRESPSIADDMTLYEFVRKLLRNYDVFNTINNHNINLSSEEIRTSLTQQMELLLQAPAQLD